MAALLYNWRLADNTSVEHLTRAREAMVKNNMEPAPILFEGFVQDHPLLPDGTCVSLSAVKARRGDIILTEATEVRVRKQENEYFLGGPASDYAKENTDARLHVMEIIPDLNGQS